MTQQTATRQGLCGGEPLPSLPRHPRPRPCAAPGRSPAGEAAGGEEQRCCRGHPGPVHRLAAAAGFGIPKTGARGSGRGLGAWAAAAAALGGREWGAAAGARLMTSRRGCGSAGARTWLRRLRLRRPRVALGLERPAPSRGAVLQSVLSSDSQTRCLGSPTLGASTYPASLGRIAGELGVRGRQGAKGEKGAEGASRRCYPQPPTSPRPAPRLGLWKMQPGELLLAGGYLAR